MVESVVRDGYGQACQFKILPECRVIGKSIHSTSISMTRNETVTLTGESIYIDHTRNIYNFIQYHNTAVWNLLGVPYRHVATISC